MRWLTGAARRTRHDLYVLPARTEGVMRLHAQERDGVVRWGSRDDDAAHPPGASRCSMIDRPGGTSLADRTAALSRHTGLSRRQEVLKRAFDIAVSSAVLLLLGGIIIVGAAISAVAHGGSGFFVQRRIGRHGRAFPLVKLTTMRRTHSATTSVTTASDPRITAVGRLLRRTKLDELPQFGNVLVGHMSLVGPRPDVRGFADVLEGDDRIILSVRPGITGPASLAYRDEESLLAAQADPERYNQDVIYPDKVRINRRYVEMYTFQDDLRCLWRTLVGC